MPDCIFCKIIAGDIPAARVLETEEVVCFLDISPVNPGHTLVVPVRHAEGLADLTERELHAVAVAVQRIAGAVKGATGSPASNVLQNDGEAAGQVVKHVHFHVVPRSDHDGYSMGWRQLQYAEGELEAMQEAVRSRL